MLNKDSQSATQRVRLSQKAKNRFKIALGWLAIGVVTYIGIWLIGSILSLEKEVSIAILAGMITVLGSSLSFTLSRYYEKRRDIEKEIREKKLPIYTKFIEYTLKNMLAPEHLKEKSSENEQAKQLQNFTVEVLIWGSNDVLKEWINFRNALVIHGKDGKNARNEFNTLVNGILPTGNFLLGLRKDIGHKNNDLTSYQVMRLFVNDLDDVMMRAIGAARTQDRE